MFQRKLYALLLSAGKGKHGGVNSVSRLIQQRVIGQDGFLHGDLGW